MTGDEMLVGGARFAQELREAGTEVEELGDEHIMIPRYHVLDGKCKGLRVDIGIVVPPDFPLSPPGGPHVHQLIHPNNPNGPHPSGHVHASKDHSVHFKDRWQYWSRPFPNWKSGARNAVRYMEYVQALWESQ
ncbi:hypothetical protein [Candidatus Palauibacter irciniicola]|uniref:hypothetical protein n=1 Tax=Candidatus Palauibacter irciniicola TaxID=3056733 RepID=UPI003B024D19